MVDLLPLTQNAASGNVATSIAAGRARLLKAVEGRCLCGSITFQYEGSPNWTLHCHCESCRRATSSPLTTWISVPRRIFSFTKGTPRYFCSSPGGQARFLRELWLPPYL